MSQVITKKKIQQKNRRKKIIKLILLAVVAFLIFIVLYSVTVIANSPKIDPSDVYSNLSESSTLYDDNGKIIETIYQGDGNRINVDYDQLPDNLINAIVSIEDKTFWSHHGFNFIRMLGAIKEGLFSKDEIGGTSTITQQLARNVYLPDTKTQRSLNRKLSEAYYTVLLERTLSKKQIIEAYLNTIYFGYNSYGVQAASQAYFSKDVEDLNLSQCVALAAIPKSPDSYSLVKTLDNNTIEEEALKLKKKDIIYKSPNYTIVYNGDTSVNRRNLALQNMNDQGYITENEKKTAMNTLLIKQINLSENAYKNKASYFTDFVVEQIISDLVEAGYDKETARKMVYSGGLKINTSLNLKVQDAIDNAFSESSNFPSVANVNYNSKGDIINDQKNILLHKYSNYINARGNFVMTNKECYLDDSGNMVLTPGHKLNFYSTTSNGKEDYRIEIKDMYVIDNGIIYTIEGTTLLIPQKYKSMDSSGNLIVDKKFIEDYSDFFVRFGSGYMLDSDCYGLSQKVRQPQGAMVVTDYKTGEIKGMSGGRETKGKFLYNRAKQTRQPGSSIKPLAIYSTALQQGADAAAKGTGMKFINYDKNQITSAYGSFWTAASRINDAPLTINGQVWPKNWYNGYRGLMSLRKSVEQSVNVNAVRVFQQIGPDDAIEQLKKFGISSVVESGDTNDKNASALALGGMTKGISPIEMASAYGTFPNKGKFLEYSSYTKVTDKNDEILLDNTPKETKVINEGVAYIMTDILQTTVSRGVATAAKTNQPTGGKTGTTTDNFDAWFCGFTPQYSAACWIGNDVNIELSEGSAAAAQLWKNIMNDITNGAKGSFPAQPSSVVKIGGEYYVDGTQKIVPYETNSDSMTEPDTGTVSIKTCSDTGYLATPWCKSRVEKTISSTDDHSKYYCPNHNQDPDKYPIPPGYSVRIKNDN